MLTHRSYISFLLFIIPSIAEDNLFLDDESAVGSSFGPDANLGFNSIDTNPKLSFNSASLNDLDMITSNPSTTDDEDIFTSGSLGEDLYVI